MFNDILNGFESELNDSALFDQVEPYEGQFEDISNFIIKPPAAFIQIDAGTNEQDNYLDMETNIDIYLCASHMKVNEPTAMYNLLWNTIDTLHVADINYDGSYLGRAFFKGMERLGIFPGFAVYKTTFRFDINQ